VLLNRTRRKVMVGFERLLATDMREECKAGVRRTNRYEAARFLNVDDRLPTLFHSEPPALRRQVGEKRAEGNSVAAKTFYISSRRFDRRNAEEFGKLASCLVASLDKTPCVPRIPSQYSHINLLAKFCPISEKKRPRSLRNTNASLNPASTSLLLG
jgi:hypothetical protein